MRLSFGPGQRLDTHGVYISLHQVAERIINHSVAANPVVPLEGVGDDRNVKMTAAVTGPGVSCV